MKIPAWASRAGGNTYSDQHGGLMVGGGEATGVCYTSRGHSNATERKAWPLKEHAIGGLLAK